MSCDSADAINRFVKEQNRVNAGGFGLPNQISLGKIEAVDFVDLESITAAYRVREVRTAHGPGRGFRAKQGWPSRSRLTCPVAKAKPSTWLYFWYEDGGVDP